MSLNFYLSRTDAIAWSFWDKGTLTTREIRKPLGIGYNAPDPIVIDGCRAFVPTDGQGEFWEEWRLDTCERITTRVSRESIPKTR